MANDDKTSHIFYIEMHETTKFTSHMRREPKVHVCMSERWRLPINPRNYTIERCKHKTPCHPKRTENLNVEMIVPKF